MIILISAVLTALAILLAVPALIYSVEIILGSLFAGGRLPLHEPSAARERIAVLIPAHNEGTGLLATIGDVNKQLRSGDRILVVADNCSDETASVAAGVGAETIARHDLARIGKGYALEFGLDHLAKDPPAVVIIIDADCRVADETLDRLTAVCTSKQRPVQALNLMTAPEAAAVNYQVAEFAWRVKNWARPLGLATLGLPCQLMGTGMAFPWNVIRSAEVGTGFIVEDLKLGFDLASAGAPPMFCPSAKVLSAFPAQKSGADQQRQRWESGHLQLIFKLAPRMMVQALAQPNFDLFVLALDLLVPPLSLLVFCLIAMVMTAGVAALFGIPSPALFLSTASLSLFVAATAGGWYRYGRDILPVQVLPMMASYLLAKFRIYRHILLGRSPTQWVRADRTKSKPTGRSDFNRD